MPITLESWDQRSKEPRQERLNVPKVNLPKTEGKARNVLLLLQPQLLSEIDKIVHELDLDFKMTGGITDDVRNEMRKIAKADGIDAANEYVAKNRMPKPSRHSIALYMIELGIEKWRELNP